MNVLRTATGFQANGRRLCLAIGFFDGVHLGHQEIIRQTLLDAEAHEAIPLVITFDHHPATVIAPDRAPSLIHTLKQRMRVIESLGMGNLLLLHFDKTLSLKSGEEFIQELARDLGPIQSICVGASFTFGYRRSGNVELLRNLGGGLGFLVRGLAAVCLDGDPVSSTRIREEIQSGNLNAAGRMLGRPYSISGPVISGAGLGTQLGIPTANLEAQGLQLPPHGVYAAHARLAGESHQAVLNIGLRPTVQSSHATPSVEAHLLDFEGSLYGKELELEFIAKLREERKFPSLDELKAQISRDISEARILF